MKSLGNLLIGSLRRSAALSDKVPVTPTGDKKLYLLLLAFCLFIFCMLFVDTLAGIGLFNERGSVRLSIVVLQFQLQLCISQR